MLRFICLVLYSLISYTSYAANVSFFSNAFAENVPMPVLYTCDGKDISPELAWTGLPSKTESIAIIFSDKDAPNGIFYHWVIYNIPKTTTSLPQAIATLPIGSMMGKNSWGKNQYNGPCPPKGTLHHYTFTLYALDKKLSTPPNLDAAALIKIMQGHILQKIELPTVYTRWLI